MSICINPEEYKKEGIVTCHENCFHYGMFGGVNGCEASGFHEQIEAGQICLYPQNKEMCLDLGTFSMLEVCSALAGDPLIDPKTSEPSNFTKLLISLDSTPRKSD